MSTERYVPPPEAASAPAATPSVPAQSPQSPQSTLDETPAYAQHAHGPPLSGNLAGQSLRHFRVDKRLASGGMGDVYLGFDTSLQRPVAIKTIRPELAKDASFLSRFTREAIAQANVVHPHVVQVYFVGEDRGVCFLAMQVVDGGSLHDTVEGNGKLAWQDAVRHMTDVCAGLVVAERLGIVHRDIKPANILKDKAGRALLSDFGLAASAGSIERGTTDGASASAQPSGSQLQLANVTQVGMVMGTPEYVAPEQLRPGTPVDTRADQFSLAATFFHLVTGRPPSEAKTLVDAIARFGAQQRAPLVRSVAPQVPRSFAKILDRCLALDAAERYPSMAALHDALEAAAPQPMVNASPALRALVWLIDVVPFVLASLAAYERAPWLGPLLFLSAGWFGAFLVHSTPGVWLMRLRLRTAGDGDVSPLRAFARFLVQHGWYLPTTAGVSAAYASSGLDVLFYPGAVWLAASVIGAAPVFTASGRALHDIVTGTRVLVDVRWRA
jgi:serine/threonine protein kinase